MSAAGKPTSSDALKKRIPANRKYRNVKAAIDTGASITKQKEKIEELKKNYRIGKNEIFRRLKVTTFVQLLLQMSEIDMQEEFEEELGSAEENGDNTQRSAFESLVTGVGELQVEPSNENSSIFHEDPPFILLDVRDRDEYEKCRIISAVSFAHTLLSRSDNYQTKEMQRYRNQEGKIIILYDNDERVAPRVASVLVQRGYDNLFLLSGGLRMAKKLFPESLTTGTNEHPVENESKDKFTQEDISRLRIYLDNAITESDDSSLASTSKSTASTRSTASQSDRPPFK